MKIFKDTTNWSTKYLLKNIKTLSVVMYSIGLITGITIIMAVLMAKNNDFENVLLLVGATIFFLFLSILFYAFLCTKIITEIEKRLRNESENKN